MGLYDIEQEKLSKLLGDVKSADKSEAKQLEQFKKDYENSLKSISELGKTLGKTIDPPSKKKLVQTLIDIGHELAIKQQSSPKSQTQKSQTHKHKKLPERTKTSGIHIGKELAIKQQSSQKSQTQKSQAYKYKKLPERTQTSAIQVIKVETVTSGTTAVSERLNENGNRHKNEHEPMPAVASISECNPNLKDAHANTALQQTLATETAPSQEHMPKQQAPVKDLPVIKERSLQLVEIRSHIAFLRVKQERFDNEKDRSAYNAAKDLCDKMDGICNGYEQGLITAEQFDRDATTYIKEAHTVLDKHRAYLKNILANLLLAIATLVVGYGIAALVKWSLFPIVTDTDSKIKVDRLSGAVKRMSAG